MRARVPIRPGRDLLHARIYQVINDGMADPLARCVLHNHCCHRIPCNPQPPLYHPVPGTTPAMLVCDPTSAYGPLLKSVKGVRTGSVAAKEVNEAGKQSVSSQQYDPTRPLRTVDPWGWGGAKRQQASTATEEKRFFPPKGKGSADPVDSDSPTGKKSKFYAKYTKPRDPKDAKPGDPKDAKPGNLKGSRTFDLKDTKPLDTNDSKPLDARDTKPWGAKNTKPLDARDTKPWGAKDTKPWGAKDSKPWGAKDSKPWGAKDSKPLDARDTKPWGAKDTKPWNVKDSTPFDPNEGGPWDPKDAPLPLIPGEGLHPALTDGRAVASGPQEKRNPKKDAQDRRKCKARRVKASSVPNEEDALDEFEEGMWCCLLEYLSGVRDSLEDEDVEDSRVSLRRRVGGGSEEGQRLLICLTPRGKVVWVKEHEALKKLRREKVRIEREQGEGPRDEPETTEEGQLWYMSLKPPTSPEKKDPDVNRKGLDGRPLSDSDGTERRVMKPPVCPYLDGRKLCSREKFCCLLECLPVVDGGPGKGSDGGAILSLQMESERHQSPPMKQKGAVGVGPREVQSEPILEVRKTQTMEILEDLPSKRESESEEGGVQTKATLFTCPPSVPGLREIIIRNAQRLPFIMTNVDGRRVLCLGQLTTGGHGKAGGPHQRSEGRDASQLEQELRKRGARPDRTRGHDLKPRDMEELEIEALELSPEIRGAKCLTFSRKAEGSVLEGVSLGEEEPECETQKGTTEDVEEDDARRRFDKEEQTGAELVKASPVSVGREKGTEAKEEGDGTGTLQGKCMANQRLDELQRMTQLKEESGLKPKRTSAQDFRPWSVKRESLRNLKRSSSSPIGPKMSEDSTRPVRRPMAEGPKKQETKCSCRKAKQQGDKKMDRSTSTPGVDRSTGVGMERKDEKDGSALAALRRKEKWGVPEAAYGAEDVAAVAVGKPKTKPVGPPATKRSNSLHLEIELTEEEEGLAVSKGREEISGISRQRKLPAAVRFDKLMKKTSEHWKGKLRTVNDLPKTSMPASRTAPQLRGPAVKVPEKAEKSPAPVPVSPESTATQTVEDSGAVASNLLKRFRAVPTSPPSGNLLEVFIPSVTLQELKNAVMEKGDSTEYASERIAQVLPRKISGESKASTSPAAALKTKPKSRGHETKAGHQENDLRKNTASPGISSVARESSISKWLHQHRSSMPSGPEHFLSELRSLLRFRREIVKDPVDEIPDDGGGWKKEELHCVERTPKQEAEKGNSKGKKVTVPQIKCKLSVKNPSQEEQEKPVKVHRRVPKVDPGTLQTSEQVSQGGEKVEDGTRRSRGRLTSDGSAEERRREQPVDRISSLPAASQESRLRASVSCPVGPFVAVETESHLSSLRNDDEEKEASVSLMSGHTNASSGLKSLPSDTKTSPFIPRQCSDPMQPWS
ncbi:unnamed protein product [Cyprideis torosa]|uniref:Uncharacterized protein n=1 Tax=Cyprideis torosa TaxID=163714 RepID=A0A7R8W2F4_9CRUS|nr:unnamed protein product [Cyprideis torosa]CAG0881933.1 unnamed protein product [Cyprideis torosa]